MYTTAVCHLFPHCVHVPCSGEDAGHAAGAPRSSRHRQSALAGDAAVEHREHASPGQQVGHLIPACVCFPPLCAIFLHGVPVIYLLSLFQWLQ